jgi:light-regulated signal transduction histidine kinase (bacteriophytochrome)
VPPDSSEPTRPTRRRRTWWGVYSVVVLLIASFAGWSTATVLEVDRLRARLAHNVGWLVELQEIQVRIAQADGAAAEAVVRARLQSLATQIADSQSHGDAALVSLRASRGSPPSRAAMVEATDGFIRDLRDDNAAASRRIGAHRGSMSVIDRIFERFVKASGRATQNKPGAGLGLTISKAIVEALGGHIGVRSGPGEGSSFYFEFPLSLEPARVRADNEGSESAADQTH